jgi:hypothetical protein
MIISASAGVKNSYNSGRIIRSSYGTFINGFKFNVEEYGTSSNGDAFLLFELYLDYLVINDEIIVDTPVQLGSFDGSLADVTYRDDGYGLGNAVIVDMLNNYNYFAKNDIIFYPSSASAGANGFTLKTREKTRVVAVFRDYWDWTGGEVTWTLFMNYPWTNLNSNKELFIAEAIGDATAGFDNKDLNSVSESLFTW